MISYFIVGGFLTFIVFPAIFKKIPKLRIKYGNSKRATGAVGESKVNRCLRKFKGAGFACAKDIMIPSGYGKTSQIDNILISRYGIFVIETKNYNGIVKGKEFNQNWVHIFPGRSKKSHEFYNPIWQNEGHIKALRRLLAPSFPNMRYHNIVVFSDDCRAPQFPGVVRMSKLRDELNNRMSGRPVFKEKDVAAINEIIKTANIKDSKKKEDHILFAQSVSDFAKERELEEIKQIKDEKNKEISMVVQNALNGGLGSVDSAIAAAEKENIVLEQNNNRDFFEVVR